MKAKTPLSEGVYLSERELSKVFAEEKRLKTFQCDLQSYVESFGIHFYWCEDYYPDRYGFIVKMKTGWEMWVPHSTELGERYCVGHEMHHFFYAKEWIGFQNQTWIETARSEGKADAYAAMFCMPLLPEGFDGELLEDHIRLMFGPYHTRGAHYRILQARKDHI